jgi:hypothetical protein
VALARRRRRQTVVLAAVDDLHRLDALDDGAVDAVLREGVGVLLQVLEADPVVRRVAGDGHHESGSLVGVEERRRQDGQLVAGDGVRRRLADEVGALDGRHHLRLVVLVGELRRRLGGEQPRLAVDTDDVVRDLGVDQQVGDAVHRLGAERRGGEDAVAEFELDDGVLQALGVFSLQQVVGRDRVLVLEAVFRRVEALLDVSPLLQALVLPLDEAVVRLLVRGELPAPVDGEAEALEAGLVGAVDEVARVVHRLLEPLQHLGRDVVRLAKRRYLLLVALLDAVERADDRCPGDVPRHRKQDVLPLHPLVAREHVREHVRPDVPEMHPAARVRVRDGDVELLLGRRVRFEQALALPLGLPLPLDGGQVVAEVVVVGHTVRTGARHKCFATRPKIEGGGAAFGSRGLQEVDLYRVFI